LCLTPWSTKVQNVPLQDELLTWTSQLRTSQPSIFAIHVQHIAYCITCTTSAGASLYMRPPELQQLTLNFLAPFLVVVTFVLNFLATFFFSCRLKHQPWYICTRPENFFTLPSMRPWAYVRYPHRGVRGGVLPPALCTTKLINTAARLVRAHLDFCTSWGQTQGFLLFQSGDIWRPYTLCYKLASFLHW